MVSEREETLQALQIAIQMEIDGKEYYLKSSRESGNEVGRRLLELLAAQEDFHQQKFSEIYDAIRNRRSWPVIILRMESVPGLKTIFAEATAEIAANLVNQKVLTTELGAIEKAMEMENKTYDFYTSRSKRAGYEAEWDFYQSVAAEERGHYLALLGYDEYLKDPAAWFVKEERPSLDGG